MRLIGALDAGSAGGFPKSGADAGKLPGHAHQHRLQSRKEPSGSPYRALASRSEAPDRRAALATIQIMTEAYMLRVPVSTTQYVVRRNARRFAAVRQNAQRCDQNGLRLLPLIGRHRPAAWAVPAQCECCSLARWRGSPSAEMHLVACDRPQGPLSKSCRCQGRE